MGQGEILEFLKRNPEKWFTANEIMMEMENNCNPDRCLRSLREHGEIRYEKEICRGSGKYRYRYKYR